MSRGTPQTTLRLDSDRKQAWVHAAYSKGKSLAEWLRELGDEASGYVQATMDQGAEGFEAHEAAMPDACKGSTAPAFSSEVLPPVTVKPLPRLTGTCKHCVRCRRVGVKFDQGQCTCGGG
jgi:hypothetical protein